MSQWVHVVHTFQNGNSRIYVNGALDGISTSTGAPLAIKSPARMYMGGWYDNYRFVGDIDEVRISKVTRSADWVKLQYENQKPKQTAVGPLVQAGDELLGLGEADHRVGRQERRGVGGGRRRPEGLLDLEER